MIRSSYSGYLRLLIEAGGRLTLISELIIYRTPWIESTYPPDHAEDGRTTPRSQDRGGRDGGYASSGISWTGLDDGRTRTKVDVWG